MLGQLVTGQLGGGVGSALEHPLPRPAVARLVGSKDVLEGSNVRGGLSVVELEGLDGLDVLENVAELTGHPLDLLVGEPQPGQPRDVQYLVAVDHGGESRFRPPA